MKTDYFKQIISAILVALLFCSVVVEASEWPCKQAYRNRQELFKDFGMARHFEGQSKGRSVVAFSFTEGSGLLRRYIYIYRQDEDEGWWNCIQFKRAQAYSTTIKLVGTRLIISGEGVPDEIIEFDAKDPQ